jgi:hypothetical protein
MSLELKKRFNKILYTLKHKKAFLQVEKQLRGKNTWRGYLHDADKPFLYMALWIKFENIQKIHRKNNRHHVRNNLSKTKEDLLDTIIDWECAKITKPDKPLNAYETLMKYYPDKQEDFLPLIREYLPQQIKDACRKHQFEYKTRHLRFENHKTSCRINLSALNVFNQKNLGR